MMAIGYDLYTKLLAAAIKELKGEKEEEEIRPTLEFDVNAYISDEYITNASVKMEIYRKMATAETLGEIDDLEEEIEDRFGDIPEATRNLIIISKLRVLATKLKIASIIQQGEVINIKFHESSQLTPEMLFRLKTMMANQVNIIGTENPTITIKTRGNQGTKMLLRLQKVLQDMDAMQQVCDVV